jgi:HD-like signal output (HDOD) protein
MTVLRGGGEDEVARSSPSAREERAPRVMVIEESPELLRAFERMLRHDLPRWRQRFVPGFAQAFVELGAEPADVLVAGVDPARVEHRHALARLKADHPRVVRVALAAPAGRDAALALAPLCHQFLAKPGDVPRLREALDRTLGLCALLEDADLRALLGGIDALPSPPAVLLELQAALGKPRTDALAVARIVEQDGALTAKLLQLANSALFGASRSMSAGTVASVVDAVVLLGLATVQQLALVEGVFSAFVGRTREEELGCSPALLRRHATLVAHLAAGLMTSRQAAQEAYVAGLLHDVGKLILAWRGWRSSPVWTGSPLPAEARRRRLPVWQVELERHGTTHAEIGAYLLGCWGLPRAVVEAVAHHHRPSRLGRAAFDAVGAVHVAEALVQETDAAANDPAADPTLYLDLAYLERSGASSRLPAFRDLALAFASRA